MRRIKENVEVSQRKIYQTNVEICWTRHTDCMRGTPIEGRVEENQCDLPGWTF